MPNARRRRKSIGSGGGESVGVPLGNRNRLSRTDLVSEGLDVDLAGSTDNMLDIREHSRWRVSDLAVDTNNPMLDIREHRRWRVRRRLLGMLWVYHDCSSLHFLVYTGQVYCYLLLNRPERSHLSKWLSFFFCGLIFLSVIMFILSTETPIYRKCPWIFDGVETGTVLIFTVE